MKKRLRLVVVSLIVSIIFYSLFLETQWLEVTDYKVRFDIESPLKIAHLTDLHLKRIGRLEQKIFTEIKEQKPDLILVTGDSFDDNTALPHVKEFFNSLKTPLGTWVVRGNWENWNPIQNERAFWSDSDAHLLVNQTEHIRKDIDLIGYDDEMSGKPNRNPSSSNQGKLRLCMFHSPVIFDEVFNVCDLSFSGHTHGGHFRLPFWGPIWLPPGTGNYIWGWYQKNGSRMYVSRGLGSSLLPIRFLARPELSFITISR